MPRSHAGDADRWATYQADPARTGCRQAVDCSGPEVSRRWTFETVSCYRPSTAVADGMVYVAVSASDDDDDHLYALDVETGTQRWERATDIHDTRLTVADGRVFVSGNPRITAFDAATGDREWSVDAVGSFESAPAVWDGTVYAGSHDKVLYALDAETGEFEWTYRSDLWIESTPAVANGTVYLPCDSDDQLYAFDAETGDIVWTADIDRQRRSSPAVADGVVYLNDRSYCRAFDAETGAERWAAEIEPDSTTTPAVAGDTVVVAGSDDNGDCLYALHAETGDPKWTESELMRLSPVIAGDTVLAGRKRVSARDIKTGEQRWAYDVEIPRRVGLSVIDRAIFVPTKNDAIHAISV